MFYFILILYFKHNGMSSTKIEVNVFLFMVYLMKFSVSQVI
jgi:hypothetical protein